MHAFLTNADLGFIQSIFLLLEIVFLEGAPLFPTVNYYIVVMYRRVGISCFLLTVSQSFPEQTLLDI